MKPYKPRIVMLSTEKIITSPLHPRKEFDEIELKNLGESIKRFGMISPILVRKTGRLYELICGERRLRAAKLMNIKKVPCSVIKAGNARGILLCLTENGISRDLGFFEHAEALSNLIRITGLPKSEIAARLNIPEEEIEKKLSLLSLSERERLYAINNRLTESHCYYISSLDDPKARLRLLFGIAKGPEKKASLPLKSVKTIGAIKDVGFFYNMLSRAAAMMNNSGYDTVWSKQERTGEVEINIKIIYPKQKERAD